VKLDFKPEVELCVWKWSFCACAMHPAIIIGTVRLLWTWLWAHTTFHRTNVWFLFIFYYCYDWVLICYTNTDFVAEDGWTSLLLCSFVVAVVNLLFVSCTVYSSDVLAHAFDVCR